MPHLTLTAPSRLHFGLWSFGQGAGRQFGGAGLMLQEPSLRLTVQGAKGFSVTGHAQERAEHFAHRWAQFYDLPLPKCNLQIEQTIPQHAGLGSGTQLALGVAAALSHFVGLHEPSPQELATSVGRGLRSAVGTYGFAFGGLVVEQGKQPGESISPLDCRIELPTPWQFVLARPLELSGLAGQDELLAFDRLPPVPTAVTEELVALARDELAPSAAAGDFAAFADGLYRYGRLSGECFADRQGGPYNGPLVTNLVERIRRAGHAGVGQSSWGPTVFVATPSISAAQELAGWLAAETGMPLDVCISRPASDGARIEYHAHEVN
jgi:beta-RFAP synthase